MEPSKTHKSRLPRLISRAFKRAPSKNTTPPNASVPDRHAPKASRNFFNKLGFSKRVSKLPLPKTAELRSQSPAAGHGGGCFPRLFKRRVNSVPSSKTLSKDRSKALPSLPRAPKERSHFTKLSQKAEVSPVPTRIPKPTELRCIRESFDFIDISPKSEHPSAFESRYSENLALAAEVVVGNPAMEQRHDALLMESSNVSLDSVKASTDAFVAVAANIVPIDIVNEVVIASEEQPSNMVSSIPFPSAHVEELVEAYNNGQDSVIATPVSAPVEVPSVLVDTPVISPPLPALLTVFTIGAFGTNPVLADDVVQAFMKTSALARRPRRIARVNIPVQKLVEMLAILEDPVFSTAVNELDPAAEAFITIKDPSSPPVSNNSSAEDTPTSEELSPAISFVDSESVYSCSSAPYSNHEEYFATLGRNELDLETKCSDAPGILSKEDEKAGPSSACSRPLAARRARPSLFISIPPRPSHLPIALGSEDIGTSDFHSSTTERLNSLRASRTASATFVPFRQASSSVPSSPEDISRTVPESSNQRRNRRHGTIYAIPPVPALDPSRYEDAPLSSSCSTPGPVSTPSGGCVSESRSSIFYRSEPKSGLRPLMLPQYAGEGRPNNGLRSILKRPAPPKDESPISPPPSSENASSNVSGGSRSDSAPPCFRPLSSSEDTTIKSSANTSSNPSGACESRIASPSIRPLLSSEHIKSSENIFSNPSGGSESDRARPYLRPLLLPEHIKLRRTMSGPRLHPQPGPAF